MSNVACLLFSLPGSGEALVNVSRAISRCDLNDQRVCQYGLQVQKALNIPQSWGFRHVKAGRAGLNLGLLTEPHWSSWARCKFGTGCAVHGTKTPTRSVVHTGPWD